VIVLLSSAVLAGAVLSAVLKSAAAVASAALSQRVLLQLRTEIYARLQRLSFRFYDSGQSSSIINESIRSVKLSIFQRMSTFQPLMGLLTQLNMLVLIGYGGRLVIQGQLSLGSGLFVFAGLLQEFAAQVAHITGIVNSVQSSLASAGQVFEILDEPEEIRDAESAGHLSGVRESLEFRSVSFGYVPDQPVLEDISLKLRVGECVAITGPTGAGKTTLLMLLKRFYDPTRGEILIDGRPLRDLRLADVRAASGLVFQDSFLFGSSIAENIAFGAPEAAREDIESAAWSASAHEFICGLPDGYDSVVGEHVANLSGGQVTAEGTAEQLLERSTWFRRLAELQSGGAAVWRA